MVAIDSALSAGPYDWLIPIQPNPNAETSRPCRPSLRLPIMRSSVHGGCARDEPPPSCYAPAMPQITVYLSDATIKPFFYASDLEKLNQALATVETVNLEAVKSRVLFAP